MLVPKEFREHLEKHIGESKFETPEQWTLALKNEIDSVLLPMMKKSASRSKGIPGGGGPVPRLRSNDGRLLVEERLDAVMDRALRRQFRLRAQKQGSEAAQKMIQRQIDGSPGNDRKS